MRPHFLRQGASFIAGLLAGIAVVVVVCVFAPILIPVHFAAGGGQ